MMCKIGIAYQRADFETAILHQVNQRGPTCDKSNRLRRRPVCRLLESLGKVVHSNQLKWMHFSSPHSYGRELPESLPEYLDRLHSGRCCHSSTPSRRHHQDRKVLSATPERT